MPPEKKGEGESVGVELLQKLTAALERNTTVQFEVHNVLVEVGRQISGLRQDLEAVGGLTDNVCAHLTTGLRVLDHVASIGTKRPPGWLDVTDVLQEIKDEILKEQEDGEDEEEDEEGDEIPAPVSGQEIFPPKK